MRYCSGEREEMSMQLKDWLAVILAANAAVAVGIVWHGPLFRTGRALIEGAKAKELRSARSYGPMVVVMLIGAAMLGHGFARIGTATLAAKPWLYFMQSGGVALAFVIPAVWISHARSGMARRARLVDCGFWLAAYLTMGVVFWAMG
jgi:Protein of unknown function (DUF1761)